MTRMTRLLLLSCSVLAACAPGSPSDSEVQVVASALRYTKDPRTGLCFAALSFTSYAGYRGTSIANVPCDSVPEFRAAPVRKPSQHQPR